MVETWRWDETLFRGTASYYQQGRLPYAPGFVDAIVDALGLDGQGRLLDVGCGPGTVSLALSGRFTEVVGVDPDEEMLVEANRRAERLNVHNARWVRAQAEDLPAGLGEFRVAMFAQSFHWTDRDAVAATVYGMLSDGGAFVHMSDFKQPPARPLPLPRPAPPKAAISELAQRYLGPVRRAGQGKLHNGTPDREDLVLTRAGFQGPERIIVPGQTVVRRSADDIVAWVFSRSDTAPHLFGDQVEEFERDLRAMLRESDDDFAEQLPDTEIQIFRKVATTG